MCLIAIFSLQDRMLVIRPGAQFLGAGAKVSYVINIEGVSWLILNRLADQLRHNVINEI